ncbi:hypothetical protein [Mucilaginibacter sp. FT3.2]|uniref:hypothetical protein n=1 Tax=Mucilaginibacter sp. FT3.2 TaxID=2723090 RepID=UPI0016168087|nr:hypothetical protein [Mucilaginibacter sp. FT3.2]MBB6232492.1 hypothetical protein [Mucilaginibacter sp. FT3.2]
MEPKTPGDEYRDFSTLSGIMEYFNKVPFETFKKELNEWFIKELPKKRPDLISTDGKNRIPPELSKLVAKIFKIAEEKDQSNLN